MRRLARSIVLGTLLLATASVAVVAPAEAHRRHPTPWHCRPGHSNVVSANTRAEVFEIGFDEPRFEGCAYGQTHRYALGPVGYGSSSGSYGSDDYRLAGTTVAFTEWSCPGALAPPMTSCGEALSATSLRSGRRLHRVSVRAAQCNGHILALLLREDGALAWIAANDKEGCPVRAEMLEVHALDSSGERVLAVGENIDSNSLALAGSALYWTQGGKPFSATLK